MTRGRNRNKRKKHTQTHVTILSCCTGSAAATTTTHESHRGRKTAHARNSIYTSHLSCASKTCVCTHLGIEAPRYDLAGFFAESGRLGTSLARRGVSVAVPRKDLPVHEVLDRFHGAPARRPVGVYNQVTTDGSGVCGGAAHPLSRWVVIVGLERVVPPVDNTDNRGPSARMQHGQGASIDKGRKGPGKPFRLFHNGTKPIFQDTAKNKRCRNVPSDLTFNHCSAEQLSFLVLRPRWKPANILSSARALL